MEQSMHDGAEQHTALQNRQGDLTLAPLGEAVGPVAHRSIAHRQMHDPPPLDSVGVPAPHDKALLYVQDGRIGKTRRSRRSCESLQIMSAEERARLRAELEDRRRNLALAYARSEHDSQAAFLRHSGALFLPQFENESRLRHQLLLGVRMLREDQEMLSTLSLESRNKIRERPRQRIATGESFKRGPKDENSRDAQISYWYLNSQYISQSTFLREERDNLVKRFGQLTDSGMKQLLIRGLNLLRANPHLQSSLTEEGRKRLFYRSMYSQWGGRKKRSKGEDGDLLDDELDMGVVPGEHVAGDHAMDLRPRH